MEKFKCESVRLCRFLYSLGFDTCPECVKEKEESSFQEKVRLYLEHLGLSLLHEHKCSIRPINPNTNMPMPYDNEIIELKLIIEVHGRQHYELTGWHITQSSHSNRTPKEEFEYQQWKDNYKKKYAIEHGYYYLEIPYYDIENENYKNLIDKTILTIQNECYKNVERLQAITGNSISEVVSPVK